MIGMPQSKAGLLPVVAGHTLCSDMDHRDPISDLHDIETGKFLAAIDALPALVREDLCSSDVRIQLDADGRIVKVLKRRNPEFLQGTEREVEVLKDGTRVPSDAELGIEESVEDVYTCCELVRGTGTIIDSEEDDDADFDLTGENDTHVVTEYSAPMDRWDVVFDATSYIQAAHQLQGTTEYRKADVVERQSMLEALGDELIYSADLFPCARDKRVHGKAALILQQIRAGKMTKALLGKLTLGTDERAKKQVALKAQIRNVTGKARGKLMVQAQAMKVSHTNAMRNARGFEYRWVEGAGTDMGSWVCVARKGNTVKNTTRLSQGEISMLWDAFRQWEIESSGSSKLPAWSYKRALSAKLQRMVVSGKVTRQEANDRYQAALVRVLKVPAEQAVSAQLVSSQY